MKILIPAAGEGTRLRPHTLTTPKPLLRLAGKTVIDFLLEPLLELKPSELCLVLGKHSEQISAHLQNHYVDRYGIRVTTVEQGQPNGLGQAVSLGLENIDLGEELLIILSDTIIMTDFKEFASAGENTIALKEVADPRRFGVALVEGTRITELVEKPSQPKSNLAVVGLYYFKYPEKLKSALRRLIESGRTTAGEIQLTDALALMLADGEPFTSHEIDNWLDCGKRETMLTTNAELLKFNRSVSRNQTDSTIDENCWIDPSVELGGSQLGPNVAIYQNTKISNSSLDNCIIGPNVELSDCQLTDSIIGEGQKVHGQTGTIDLGDIKSSNA